MIQQVFSNLPLFPLPWLLFLYPHKSVVRCGPAKIHGTNIKYQGGIFGLSIISPPLKGNHSKKKQLFCNASLTWITSNWWLKQTCCRSGSAVRASRSPEPSAFLSPDFLGPEKPRKRSRSLFGGLFGKKEVKALACSLYDVGVHVCRSVICRAVYSFSNDFMCSTLGNILRGFLQL